MNDSLIVDTSNGPVRGISDGTVSAWLGIRYAAPPVGERQTQEIPSKRFASSTSFAVTLSSASCVFNRTTSRL